MRRRATDFGSVTLGLRVSEFRCKFVFSHPLKEEKEEMLALIHTNIDSKIQD